MSFDQFAVLAVLAGMILGLAVRRFSPTAGVVGALVVLFVAGIGDAATTFSGFSNQAPITIGALYVVAGGVQRTGALSLLVKRLAGDRHFARVLVGSAAASGLVANTPIVAILIDPVVRWGRERNLAPSKLLIPLSYATILGGMTTIIGTSTNLIGSGVLTSLDREALSFFEPAKMGLPVAALGLLITTMLGGRLLPDRRRQGSDEHPDRAFTVSCSVVPGGALDGRTIGEAGLRDLPGLFLVAAQQSDHSGLTAPVGPEYVLGGGDILSFAGSVDDVVVLQERKGLHFEARDHLAALTDSQHAWYEAVIGSGSALVGRSLKQAEFRSRYQAAVVALHRSGRPVAGKLGEERLRLGDSLLLVSDLGFGQRWNRRSEFLLVRRRSEPPPTASTRAGISLAILGVVVLLSISQATDVLRAAIIGAALTVLTGVLSPRQARDAIDLNVVVLIGSAIGLGGIAVQSGLADTLAQGLVDAFSPFGAWGVALAIVLGGLVLTEVVTNAAAAAITVPIAISTAAQVGADPRTFALGAIVAASASFLTPLGYQTNTMVYGPGRYHFTDYLRLGLPITLAVVALVPFLMI